MIGQQPVEPAQFDGFAQAVAGAGEFGQRDPGFDPELGRALQEVRCPEPRALEPVAALPLVKFGAAAQARIALPVGSAHGDHNRQTKERRYPRRIGNAAEAFQFYEGVFGTKILMRQTFGETSFMSDVPEHIQSKIMHTQLPITESVHLMGSDAIEGFGPPVTYGNNFHVSVVANDKAEADRVFASLGEGGRVNMPIANAPWGPYFGMVTDRFGVNWMVSLPHPA